MNPPDGEHAEFLSILAVFAQPVQLKGPKAECAENAAKRNPPKRQLKKPRRLLAWIDGL
jgi:hypothetical protein